MLNTRLRYIKREDGTLKLKSDVIITDLFYNATINPSTLTYEVETPEGNLTGKATSTHYLKKAVKKHLESFGARFKNETRVKRKTNEQQP